MVNLHNCSHLALVYALLGCWVSWNEMTLGYKYVQNMLGVKVSQSLSELQEVLGCL